MLNKLLDAVSTCLRNQKMTVGTAVSSVQHTLADYVSDALSGVSLCTLLCTKSSGTEYSAMAHVGSAIVCKVHQVRKTRYLLT